jgi:hypothetical protein
MEFILQHFIFLFPALLIKNIFVSMQKKRDELSKM